MDFGLRDPCYMGRFVLRLRYVQTGLISVHSDKKKILVAMFEVT